MDPVLQSPSLRLTAVATARIGRARAKTAETRMLNNGIEELVRLRILKNLLTFYMFSVTSVQYRPPIRMY